MSPIELRIGALNERYCGSLDDQLQVSSTMSVEALNRVDNALASFGTLTVEDPDLHTKLNIGVILKVLHLSNRLEADTIQATFNDDRGGSGDKLVVEFIGSGCESTLNRSDLGCSGELNV